MLRRNQITLPRTEIVVLTGVASANVEDLIVGLHVLRDDILEAGVSLIPVKLLLVLLVTVFPVFLLSVLGHGSLLSLLITIDFHLHDLIDYVDSMA